jgi:hypothetical protein
MNHRVRPLVILGTVTAILVAFKPTTGADPDKPTGPQAELVEAAKQAYFATVIDHNEDFATLDDVYRWSRRWMKAELKANPNNKKPRIDHRERMQNYHDRIVALHKAGAKGGETSKRNASAYYVAEANFEILHQQALPAIE